MADYSDWRNGNWTVTLLDSNLTDLKTGDTLVFLGTGQKDGDLNRSNVTGTPPWAKSCQYISDKDWVTVEHGDQTYTITRSQKGLTCFPPGITPSLAQSKPRRGGADQDVTGASWTAHDSGTQQSHRSGGPGNPQVHDT